MISHNYRTITPRYGGPALEMPAVFLNDEAEREVLNFLDRRPAETAILSGLIRDNGMRSDFNRGDFYGCRNEDGDLEGIALIGHATLFEARTNRALYSLADRAQSCTNTHMLMGERDGVRLFWRFFAGDRPLMRKICREHLFELRAPVEPRQFVPDLRLATQEDLDLILPIHAQMALDESGVDPRDRDPHGFRARYARRIEQLRTWVWIDGETPIFKAEIISDTPRVSYLEGVWVNPERRSQGQGSNCVLQLAKFILERSESLCVFVNEQNCSALHFYGRMGFRDKGSFDTIFLQPFLRNNLD